MAKPSEEKVSFGGRLKQIGMVFKFTAKQDKWFIPLVVAAVLIPIAVTVLVVGLTSSWIWIPMGVLVTLLAVLLVLNLRSNSAMMNALEGQPGAATQILSSMRGNWRTKEQPLAFTVNNDFVHLVLGPAGVVLIGEGEPQRVKPMLGEQKRRLGKVIGQTPLYDIIVGNGEGQVSIRKLRTHILRLPKNLSGKEINSLDRALTALTARPQMPKGGLPKEFRPPKGAMRQMRGR
ncbi:MAG: DUF4191 domain-containing protein [Hamadaea sp.]|uniref:DUF4191 domain-containing protein n=1 Tax=Hamadaea sp. NPDC050747 TaxID=3155789 RepID=UPI0017CF6814|nr:DUF4191 domain-containing protein [Hamadaea sp.]NUR50689.1 DUF4191 domain-containing protein [Hamadaea sp.]